MTTEKRRMIKVIIIDPKSIICYPYYFVSEIFDILFLIYHPQNMNTQKKVCSICGKGYQRALTRSHSMRATIKRLQPNLQWLRLANGQRVKACTKCIRSISKGKIPIPQTA